MGAGNTAGGDAEAALLRRRVLCLLLRYEALGAHGYQVHLCTGVNK